MVRRTEEFVGERKGVYNGEMQREIWISSILRFSKYVQKILIIIFLSLKIYTFLI